MIKMTYVANGKKVDLHFDSVAELMEFQKNAADALEKQVSEMASKEDEKRKDDEDRLRTEFKRLFLYARASSFRPDELIEIMTDAISELADGDFDLGDDGKYEDEDDAAEKSSEKNEK